MSNPKRKSVRRKARSAPPLGSAVLPKYIWADCDPDAPRSVRWAFYNTLSDQRGNRPDLQPIKLKVSLP